MVSDKARAMDLESEKARFAKAIAKTADEIYAQLYRSKSKLTEDAVQACATLFDVKMKSKGFKEMVGAVARARGDAFISDREVASLILALERHHIRY